MVRDDLVGSSADYAYDPGHDRAFSEWAEELMAQDAADIAVAAPPPPVAARAVEVWTGGVPSLDEHWTRPERWRRLIAGAWKSSGTIHCKEARPTSILTTSFQEIASFQRQQGEQIGLLTEALHFEKAQRRDEMASERLAREGDRLEQLMKRMEF